MIQVTVALPVWNAQKIAWLCLESLKRQVNVDFEWELLIFEEDHEQKLGMDYFIRNGVENVSTRYITSVKKYTLGEKWHRIIAEANPESKGIIFCAADDYCNPYVLADTLEAFKMGYDWLSNNNGYFYDFKTGKIILYSSFKKPGICMSARMDIAKKVPNKYRPRIVDIWLYNNMKPKNPLYNNSTHWRNGLFTQGYNTISYKKREQYFHQVKFPFRNTSVKLEEIVPVDIAERIKSMS